MNSAHSPRFLPQGLAVAMVLAAATALPPRAQAGTGAGINAKPPPAPTATPVPLDSGWVYYNGDVSGTRVMYRTSPDGAINGVVAGAPADYRPGSPGGRSGVPIPSHLTHDGSRWYLVANFDSPDLIFPNVSSTYDQQAAEIDAVREGDALGVRLTTNRASCIHDFTVPYWTNSSAGVPDAAIAWAGGQWANLDGDALGTCETLVQVGIFRADLTYDGSGAVTGISAPVLALPLPLYASSNAPDVRFLSWSPNGASIAYTRESGGLYVAAAGSPISSHTRIADGNYWWVDWSPDQDAVTSGLQTTIAFTGWATGGPIKGGVWSIQPNGSGLKLLAEAKQGRNSSQVSYIHYSPFWSPSGSHLAYMELAYNGPYGFIGQKTLRRMTKDGTGNVVLHTETSTVDFDYIFAWTDAN